MEEGPSKKLSQSLMETLKTMEREDSSSDEDSDEQNRIMFEKTLSSAGSKLFLCRACVFVQHGVDSQCLHGSVHSVCYCNMI